MVPTSRLRVLLETLGGDLRQNVICDNHTVFNHPRQRQVHNVQFTTDVVVPILIQARRMCYHRTCWDVSPGKQLGSNFFVELVLETKVLVVAIKARDRHHPDFACLRIFVDVYSFWVLNDGIHTNRERVTLNLREDVHVAVKSLAEREATKLTLCAGLLPTGCCSFDNQRLTVL
ncbi:hypothetical protein D3C73_1070640 [compost metagenome]